MPGGPRAGHVTVQPRGIPGRRARGGRSADLGEPIIKMLGRDEQIAVRQRLVPVFDMDGVPLFLAAGIVDFQIARRRKGSVLGGLHQKCLNKGDRIGDHDRFHGDREHPVPRFGDTRREHGGFQRAAPRKNIFPEFRDAAGDSDAAAGIDEGLAPDARYAAVLGDPAGFARENELLRLRRDHAVVHTSQRGVFGVDGKGNDIGASVKRPGGDLGDRRGERHAFERVQLCERRPFNFFHVFRHRERGRVAAAGVSRQHRDVEVRQQAADSSETSNESKESMPTNASS